MSFLRDLKFALRMQLKKPGFTAVAVLTLALGVGANTAIFSLVNAVYIRSLPYESADRLCLMFESSTQGLYPVAYPNFLDWREMNRSFEKMACFRPYRLTLTGATGAEKVDGKFVSANFFSTLGIRPVFGRTFTAAEDSVGGDPVVMIDHFLWQRRFGGSPDVLGRTLNLDGESRTIVGVTPAGFRFRGDCEVYLPIHPRAHSEARYNHDNLTVVARRRPGVTEEQARSDMRLVSQQLEERHPKDNAGETAAMVSLGQWMTGNTRSLVLVFVAAVAFVLLIACVNVASLLLARLNERNRELAVRAALGAGRRSLIRQALVESLLLALEGGAVGLMLASALLTSLMSFVPAEIAPYVRIDGWVLLFTLLLCCGTSVLFGSIPGLQSSRVNVAEVLKQGERSGTSAGQHRFRDLLVVSEVALALVLLIGAGLMIRSAVHLMRIDPGFRPENVVTMKVEPPDSRFLGPAQTENGVDVDIVIRILGEYTSQVMDRVRALPGIEAAASVFPLPMAGGTASFPLVVEGMPAPADGVYLRAYRYSITEDYFKVMGIPMVRGRSFTRGDNATAPRVAVISETMARQFWPDQDPMGKVFRIQNFEERPFTVVGIAGDTKHESPQNPIPPQLYLSQLQWPGSLTLVIRTPLPAEQIARAVQDKIAEFDKEAPVYGVSMMSQHLSNTMSHRRQITMFLSIFAVLALVLAIVGIYGVMSHTIGQRTREIGLRIALGASPSRVLRTMLGRAVGLSVLGVAVGIAGAFALTRWLGNWLYGVTATDPLTYAGISALIILVAFASTYRPARRAASVDPMTALRLE
jgi:putative ABC transport system permease protein